MSEHRWSVGVIHALNEAQARRVAAMDMSERLDFIAQLDADPVRIRGPLCLECGVQRRFLDRQPDKPWPCPGKRPESLGAAPAVADPTPPRQQIRAQRRKSDKASRPSPSQPDPVKARVEAAMLAARGRRVDAERLEEAVGEGYEALAKALSGHDPTEFWDRVAVPQPNPTSGTSPSLP